MISRFFINNYCCINLFFTFSFLGWVMECIIIRIENGYFENRGFATGPFCVIYGFGAILGYVLIGPFSGNLMAVYIIGAVGATIFEFFTAKLMLRFFGKLWWDYTDKSFNYKGVLCLQSTLGWGVAALIIVEFLYNFIFGIVVKLPETIGILVAATLSASYIVDFLHNFIISKVCIYKPLSLNYLDDSEYISIVEDILRSKNVQSMQDYIQHGTTSCLEHCLNVSYLSYLYCKNHNLNASSAARAGLLHDMFLYDWHNHRQEHFYRLHGFTHPKVALMNAQLEFQIAPIEANLILRHMWPLTVIPPKYKEGFVLLWYDKYCSSLEVFWHHFNR